MRVSFLLAIVFLTSCAEDQTQLHARIADWQQRLEVAVPVGKPRSDIEAWAVAHGLRLEYLPAQNEMYGNVEQVPVKGIKFPCSQWNIIVSVHLDSSGDAVRNEVRAVGSCL